MALSDQRLLHSLSRMPFIDTAELALILGEPHATVHRALTDLFADGIVGRVSHGTAQLPSSQRYHLTAKTLGFDTPSDFVRAYPSSREWLSLLIRRMDAVASVYRLAALLSPGIDGLRSHVESRDALDPNFVAGLAGQCKRVPSIACGCSEALQW